MPFCPKCHQEYNPGIFKCPDCDKWLVPVLPDEADERQSDDPTGYEEWIPLACLTSPQYAEMIVEGLRAKDIPVVKYSQAGHFGQTGQMGFASSLPGGGGYIILVPCDFVVDADKEATLMLGQEWEKCRLINID